MVYVEIKGERAKLLARQGMDRYIIQVLLCNVLTCHYFLNNTCCSLFMDLHRDRVEIVEWEMV